VEAINIAQAAQASGVSAKMIRHAEEMGLLAAPRRTDSGCRQYAASEVYTLRFIRHARDLGFSIQSIGPRVGLWQNRSRPSRQVKALAQAHSAELQAKAQEILAMKATLEHLVKCCRGDDRPDCPILAKLADQIQPDPGARRPGRARHGFAAR
jgi:Cu(I)-responsive transcriptional regulator